MSRISSLLAPTGARIDVLEGDMDTTRRLMRPAKRPAKHCQPLIRIGNGTFIFFRSGRRSVLWSRRPPVCHQREVVRGSRRG